MKKTLFTLIFLLSIVFISNPVYAADTVKQVDIGSFDVWKNSSGAWIPSDPPRYTQAYKPGDTIHVTYTITAPADKADKVVGVKSVNFVTPDNAGTAFKDALSATTYSKYDETYSLHQVKQMSNITHNYIDNSKVEISADVVLTGWVEPLGFSVKKVWQGQNVDGRQFYIPVVIEWEMADAAPDFWITSPNGTSFTGEPGSSITIPTEVWNSGEKKDTTDFISWWDGESWDNKVGYYDNLTLGYSEKADTPVTVTVPAAPKTLWFRCNIDNNTPAGESDLTNNTLAVTVGPNNADVGVSISVDTTRPKRNSRVTATVNATNHGPATADVRLVIGENNGADQVVNHYDEDVFIFTLAPGESKRLIYKSSGYPAGHSTYFATKAEVTNTTDPYLANNFARTPQIIWQAPAPPPVVPSSDIESSLIHTQ